MSDSPPTHEPRQQHLQINAFEMNAVGHLAHGLWRHPRDQARRHNDVHYWQQLARTLEECLFDGLFLADVTGVYDVFGGSADAAVRHAVQVPVGDPAVLLPAMAAVTRHLGFGLTVNLSEEQPHLFARRMSTLDHLCGGRLGWNIVTGFLDSAARATGAAAQTGHDERYDRAEDFMAAVYQLWEAGWDDGAVLADAAHGVYADPARVHRIRHDGPYYRVDALHLSAPSPQRTPVLFQAGASARGMDFAARHAEAIFIPNLGLQATAALVRRLRERLSAAGRAEARVRILTTAQVVVAATEREAHARLEEYARHAQPEAALVQLASATGIDFARYGPDEPIATEGTAGNGIRSIQEGLARGGPPTVRGLLQGMRLGGNFTPTVGSGAQVAQALIDFADATGVDGFNLARTVTPECFEDFARWVVPELQARGRFKTAHAPGTLRARLRGDGRDHLPAGHPGAAWRRTAPPTTQA